MRPCVAALCVLLLALPARADMAIPIPGCKEIPCDVEIEVPADLNGYRLFLRCPRAEPLELSPGKINRIVEPSDPRDSSGYLVTVPIAAVGTSRDPALISQAISAGLPDRASGRIQIRVHVHILDPRTRCRAAYRVEQVDEKGAIQVTTISEDGSWTREVCWGSCIAIVAIPLVLILAVRLLFGSGKVDPPTV
jgi:hypothetical protein